MGSQISPYPPAALGVPKKLSLGSVGEEENFHTNHFLVLMKGLALTCLN